MKVEPVIVLETLGKAEVYRLLAVVYTALVVCGAFGAQEDSIRGVLHDVEGKPYGSASGASFSTEVTLEPLERYFSVQLEVSAAAAGAPLPAGGGTRDMAVRVVVEGLPEGDVVHAQQRTETLRGCDAAGCDPLVLLYEIQYMYAQSETYPSYRFTVEYGTCAEDDPGCDGEGVVPTSVGDTSYRIEWHSASYRRAQMAVRGVLYVVNAVACFLYVRRLRHLVGTRRRVLREQVWVGATMAALFLFYDPFYVPLLLNQTHTMWTCSGVAAVSAVGAVIMLWLLLTDSVSAERVPARSFYAPKVAAVLTVVGGILVAVVSQQRSSSAGSDTPSTSLVGAAVALLGVMAAFFQLGRAWLRSSRRLRDLPYLTSRYRHLSFRYVTLVNTSTLVYAVVRAGVAFSTTDHRSLGPYFSTISEMLLVTVYIYTVAFIYAPPLAATAPPAAAAAAAAAAAKPSSGYQRIDDAPEAAAEAGAAAAGDGGPRGSGEAFSIDTAMLAMYLSNQAYHDAPGLQRTEGAEPEPLDHYSLLGFRVIGAAFEPKTHAYACVSRRDDLVVVAFRGTNSAVMAGQDAKLVRVEHDRLRLDGYGTRAKIHSGFYSSWKAIEEHVLDMVSREAAADRAAGHAPRVLVTGHSLGGAMATLCGVALARRVGVSLDGRAGEVFCYNFGSPRVGNHSFAAEANRAVPAHFRVCSERDVVTTVPKMFAMYKHVGTEVLVDMRGNYVEGISMVEKVFRPRRTKVAHHQMHFYHRCLRRCLVVERSLRLWVNGLAGPPGAPGAVPAAASYGAAGAPAARAPGADLNPQLRSHSRVSLSKLVEASEACGVAAPAAAPVLQVDALQIVLSSPGLTRPFEAAERAAGMSTADRRRAAEVRAQQGQCQYPYQQQQQQQQQRLLPGGGYPPPPQPWSGQPPPRQAAPAPSRAAYQQPVPAHRAQPWTQPAPPPPAGGAPHAQPPHPYQHL